MLSFLLSSALTFSACGQVGEIPNQSSNSTVDPAKPLTFSSETGWSDVIKNAGTIHSVRAYIEQQALKYGFTVIDGFTLVPHRTEYFEDNRLHPNDLGFALYTQNLIKALKPYL